MARTPKETRNVRLRLPSSVAYRHKYRFEMLHRLFATVGSRRRDARPSPDVWVLNLSKRQSELLV
jgi:hypothetical protein